MFVCDTTVPTQSAEGHFTIYNPGFVGKFTIVILERTNASYYQDAGGRRRRIPGDDAGCRGTMQDARDST